ncbi:hypothetical protein AYO38_02270 [bacterium SCGC AG-212-C10]|nr:hypothetical protein AYO38_02270 [bacterium SCGC AG-212-C10]
MATTTSEHVIRHTPGVIGGQAAVGNTRIGVWLLVGYRQLGRTDADILEGYPGLCQADLDATWEYYEHNKEEIDREIAYQDSDDEYDE